MLLRRLSLAAPLAVLVAVVMHVVLFGARHTPGTEHSEFLFTTLGAALALAALCAVLLGALRKRHGERPVEHRRQTSPLELTGGGAIAFALIELAEGHTPLGDGVWQFAALVASAFAVSYAAHFVARLLQLSGEALAALAPPVTLPSAPPVPLSGRRSLRACSAARISSCRGRAPPLFS